MMSDDQQASDQASDDYWSPENVLKRRQAAKLADDQLRFYNPQAWAEKQRRRRRRVNAISEVFVQGLPYDYE